MHFDDQCVLTAVKMHFDGCPESENWHRISLMVFPDLPLNNVIRHDYKNCLQRSVSGITLLRYLMTETDFFEGAVLGEAVPKDIVRHCSKKWWKKMHNWGKWHR